MNRLRRLLCRVLGHQSPFTWIGPSSWNLMAQMPCRRCQADVWWPNRQFTVASFLDRLSQPAIERASRRGWDQASATRTSPSQKAADTESRSARSGASR